MIVKLELEKLDIPYVSVEMGRVETTETISIEQMDRIRLALLQSGLDLMDNKRSILVERIKNVIVDMVHYSNCQLKTNFSNYLSEKLGYDYTYLANIFSEDQGATIESFVIGHKIGRVKELIENNDLNLTEISWKLHYSSVAHLSTQFKKVTGVTPSFFKHTERLNLAL